MESVLLVKNCAAWLPRLPSCVGAAYRRVILAVIRGYVYLFERGGAE